MKKRMIIIPHSIWAALLIILTITCYCMYGGPAYSFIEPWTFPLLFLWMFPLPTAISALGIMIIALARKEKEHTKLLISICKEIKPVILSGAKRVTVILSERSESKDMATNMNNYVGKG